MKIGVRSQQARGVGDHPAADGVIEDPLGEQAALDANPGARAFFATLGASNRYSVSFRVHTARKPETRVRRIADLVAMLARHETFH